MSQIIFTKRIIDNVEVFSGNGKQNIREDGGIEFVRMMTLVSSGDAIIVEDDASPTPLEALRTNWSNQVYTSERNFSIYVRPIEAGFHDEQSLRRQLFLIQNDPGTTEVLLDDVSGTPRPFNEAEIVAALVFLAQQTNANYATYKGQIAE